MKVMIPMRPNFGAAYFHMFDPKFSETLPWQPLQVTFCNPASHKQIVAFLLSTISLLKAYSSFQKGLLVLTKETS